MTLILNRKISFLRIWLIRSLYALKKKADERLRSLATFATFALNVRNVNKYR